MDISLTVVRLSHDSLSPNRFNVLG